MMSGLRYSVVEMPRDASVEISALRLTPARGHG